MSQDGEVTFVRYGFDVTDLLGSSLDANRYDIVACAQKYAEQCRDALRRVYPGAKIEVLFALEATGALPDPVTTEVLRTESFGGEERKATGLQQREVSDPVEIERVEDFCGNQIYGKYDWLVPRPWLTISEAHRQFDIPMPTIRWACRTSFLEEAVNESGRWEFPVEAMVAFADKVLSVDFQSGDALEESEDCLYQCDLDGTEYVTSASFPQIRVLVVSSSSLGIPLLSADNSSVLVSRSRDIMQLTFEHFCGEIPWNLTSWSYDTYARALVRQARQRDYIVSGLQERYYGGLPFIEGMEFDFSYELTSDSLRDLIADSVKSLRVIISEAETHLSGGPRWRSEYEKDENAFCREVLDPLLRRMGFHSVHFTHGPREYGKDFTFSELSNLGGLRHYALQAKAGNISGEVNSEVDMILGQIDDAFAMPYYELDGREERYISGFVVATSGYFTANAIEKIRKKSLSPFMRFVVFWDKDKILELISEHWTES